MTRLTDEGRRIVAEIAGRHGISEDAAQQMLEAVAVGQGTQAQFNIQELGGMGQWSQGGMTMVGDMFNNGLKARVDALCSDLSGVVRDHMTSSPASYQSQSQGGAGHQVSGVSLFVPSGPVWPEELGQPASVGTQNDMRYAYFPQTRRLAIEIGGQITVYDTGDHQITGFGQAQSGGQSLSFNSQYGLVQLSSLNVVDLAASPEALAPEVSPAAEVAPAVETEAPVASAPVGQTAGEAKSDDQIFSRIERLAGLFDKGILTQSEYETKKAELLARL